MLIMVLDVIFSIVFNILQYVFLNYLIYIDLLWLVWSEHRVHAFPACVYFASALYVFYKYAYFLRIVDRYIKYNIRARNTCKVLLIILYFHANITGWMLFQQFIYYTLSWIWDLQKPATGADSVWTYLRQNDQQWSMWRVASPDTVGLVTTTILSGAVAYYVVKGDYAKKRKWVRYGFMPAGHGNHSGSDGEGAFNASEEQPRSNFPPFGTTKSRHRSSPVMDRMKTGGSYDLPPREPREVNNLPPADISDDEDNGRRRRRLRRTRGSNVQREERDYLSMDEGEGPAEATGGRTSPCQILRNYRNPRAEALQR